MREIQVKDDFVVEMLSRSCLLKENTNKAFDGIEQFIEDLEKALIEKDIDKARDYLNDFNSLVSDSRILINDLNTCQKLAIDQILSLQKFG